MTTSLIHNLLDEVDVDDEDMGSEHKPESGEDIVEHLAKQLGVAPWRHMRRSYGDTLLVMKGSRSTPIATLCDRSRLCYKEPLNLQHLPCPSLTRSCPTHVNTWGQPTQDLQRLLSQRKSSTPPSKPHHPHVASHLGPQAQMAFKS